MVHKPEVSFIILNYNGISLLPDCLGAVEKAMAWEGRTHEVIVVDNGSSDGSVAMLKERFPFVRVIPLPENRFVTSYNEGFAASRNDICIFLNNDMRVQKDFLPPLLAHFVNEDIFGVGPLVLSPKNHPAGMGVGKSKGCFGFGYFRARGISYETVKANGLIEKDSPSLHIGAGAYDRQKYLDLGGLDPLFAPCYWEDVDLCFRAWRRGWRVIFEPQSVVYHEHQGTTSRMYAKKHLRRIMGKNRHLFIWKNLLSLRYLVLYLFFLPFRLLIPLLKGDTGPFSAFMEALKSVKQVKAGREREKQAAQKSDIEILWVSQ